MWEQCKRCPYAKYYQQNFVPPGGPNKARLAIIDESPSVMEALKKRAAIGPTGAFMQAVLQEVGVKPEEVYFTFGVKCRATKNEEDKNLLKAAECCRSLLPEELKKRGVEVAVLMGATLLDVHTGLKGITLHRGKPLRLYGCTVIPTFRPGYVLKQPNVFQDFVEDIETAVKNPNWTYQKAPAKYRVLQRFDEAVQFFNQLYPWEYVSYDIETANLLAVDNRLLCVAFYSEHKGCVILPQYLLENPLVVKAWKMADKRGVRWCAHNATFDAVRIATQLRFLPFIHDDTMLMHYTQDERPGTQGLKYLAQRYLHAEDWTGDLKQQLNTVQEELRRLTRSRRKVSTEERMALLPDVVLQKYNAADVYWTHRLAQHYEAQLKQDPDSQRLYRELLMPLSNVMAHASLHGVLIDEPLRQQLEREKVNEAERAKNELRLLVNDPYYNPNSVKQTQRWLYDVYQTPTVQRTRPVPTHLIKKSVNTKHLKPRSTAYIQLQRIAYYPEYRAHEFAKLLLQYREATKMASTYYRGLKPESDGRLHTSFKLHGTVTGRLSSSEPSIMNLPTEGQVRDLIIAPPDYVLVAADYAQAEIRTLGTLANSQRMYELFKSGKDIHAEVGKLVYLERYNNKEHRRQAKSVVFGIAYGRGTASVAETFGLSYAEAEKVKQTILQWLDVEKWMEEQYRMATELGYVTTPTGRKRRFPLITDENWPDIMRQAINAPVQGTASDITMFALIDIDRWMGEYDAHILFPTHDSILVEVPKKHAQEFALRMRESMLKAPQKVFGEQHIPFACDFGIGYRYGKKNLLDWNPDTEGLEILEDVTC